MKPDLICINLTLNSKYEVSLMLLLLVNLYLDKRPGIAFYTQYFVFGQTY
jgi:hypothetical protein